MKYHITFFTIILFGLFLTTTYLLNTLNVNGVIESQKIENIINQLSSNQLDKSEIAEIKEQSKKIINNAHLRIKTSQVLSVSILFILISAAFLYILSINKSHNKNTSKVK
jgi:hypothetical protein